MARETSRETVAFLIHLARALHSYGTPSHRLEESLGKVSEALSVEAQFLVTPTSIVASFGPEGSQKTALVRADPGGTNLDKLGRLNEVMSGVASGDLGETEALARVDSIVEAPLPYPRPVTVLAYAIASGTAAVFFQGGLREAGLAALLGGVIGFLEVLTTGRPRLSSVYPAAAATVAAAGASLAAPALQPLYPFIPTLAGLIVLIPGLSLTIAMNELAYRHWVSGTARLTAAIVTFLQIGLGVAVGWTLAERLVGVTVGADPVSLGAWGYAAALPLAAAAFTVLFRARPLDFGWIFLAAVVAFGGSRLGSEMAGPEIGAAFGAWSLGVLSNLVGRLRSMPSAITLVPGLLLLVPGSVGFQSLQALLHDDVLSGIETGFSMVLVAVSLVTGLFLANLTIEPRRLI